MTFQREELSDLENKVYRKSLDLLTDHARKVQDIMRSLVLMIDNFFSSTGSMDEHYEMVSKLEEEADEIKIELIDTLTKSAPGLLYREDFLRLMFNVEKIAETAQTVSRFIMKLSKNDMRMDPAIAEGLISLAGESLSAYEKLRSCIMALAMNPMYALKLVGEVHSAENKVDLMQQDLDLRIIINVKDHGLVLVYRDLVANLELMVDTMRDASDDVRILAMHRVL
ncbi:MAG: DUF47 family protein [Candidatus Methanosuratus sp.]|nr:DUF47 family protein [Candidatus Methanosuratincola sp.]